MFDNHELDVMYFMIITRTDMNFYWNRGLRLTLVHGIFTNQIGSIETRVPLMNISLSPLNFESVRIMQHEVCLLHYKGSKCICIFHIHAFFYLLRISVYKLHAI